MAVLFFAINPLKVVLCFALRLSVPLSVVHCCNTLFPRIPYVMFLYSALLYSDGHYHGLFNMAVESDTHTISHCCISSVQHLTSSADDKSDENFLSLFSIKPVCLFTSVVCQRLQQFFLPSLTFITELCTVMITAMHITFQSIDDEFHLQWSKHFPE